MANIIVRKIYAIILLVIYILTIFVAWNGLYSVMINPKELLVIKLSLAVMTLVGTLGSAIFLQFFIKSFWENIKKT